MSYIGRGTDKISNVEILDNITFDGSSSYTLQKNSVNFTPSSANTLLVSIDGVVQAGNFTVSGSTIDFGTAVAGTSTCDFILHYGIGLITTPADGTVTTAKLGTGAVTTAKIADDAVTEAKIGSNAVTTAKIADANVTSAKMFSGFENGITMADQWRITANSSGADGTVSSNWERNDSNGYGSIGTGMTESSGVFTLPSTGIYLVIATIRIQVVQNDTSASVNIQITENNSTFNEVARMSAGNASTSASQVLTATNMFLFDVTDTTTHKFRMTRGGFSDGTFIVGNTGYQATGFTVLRLGDT